MRLISKLLVATFALGALTTTASAAVNLVGSTGLSSSPGPAAGESMVWNFDIGVGGIEDTAHFSYVGNVYSASISNMAAEPAGDTSKFGAAEPASAGQPFTNATFSVAPGFQITSLSFDLGSLDLYNTLTFDHNGSPVTTFTGSGLTALPDGNQTSDLTNRRYYFTFGAADGINSVVFSSSAPAFEFDNIAATLVSAVPEPTTWAMMILGFGFVGFMMRGNRQKSAVASA